MCGTAQTCRMWAGVLADEVGTISEGVPAEVSRRSSRVIRLTFPVGSVLCLGLDEKR